MYDERNGGNYQRRRPMNEKSWLIFYHNAEPQRPEEVARSVQKELCYFESFLLKAINSMDVSRYKLEWEKDENLRYELYPNQILEIPKPRNRLKLFIDPNGFSERKPITNEEAIQIEYEDFEREKDGIVLILKNEERISEGEDIWYGHDKVEWKSLSSGFSGSIQLVEVMDRTYEVFKAQETAEKYILQFQGKSRVPSGSTICIKDVKVKHKERKMTTLRGIKLYDAKGFVEFSSESSRDRFGISTRRKIVGKLQDGTGRYYNYKAFSKGKNERGVWVILKELKDEVIGADDDQRTSMELFFELLSGSFDYSVWEKPFVGQKDFEAKIKVIKAIPDENRLLLVREPGKDVTYLYPPKNTYQLEMQKNAVQTLMFRPAPEHRNLLRLFEPKDRAGWEEPEKSFEKHKIAWKFLFDTDREGTDEQQGFVLKALNSPDFAILEGPPGSGKTTAISELIYQLLIQRKRVLLSASTHVAVDNVLEKLDEKFADSGGPMENGIVPLRIGREESISGDIRRYQIENRKEEMRKHFREEDWFRNSTQEDVDSFIEDLVINSSNLVCGTTIGILQFPHFRKTRRGAYIIPEFDYLIIDEASKTTFQEFLVPAIYAKKWVVVGDIRQLSPYADTLHVRVNLDGVMDNRPRERALVAFLKLLFERKGVYLNKKLVNPPSFIYVDKAKVIQEFFEILVGKLIAEDRGKRRGNRYPLSDSNFAFVVQDETTCPMDDESLSLDNVDIITPDSLKLKTPSLFLKHIIFIEERLFRRYWKTLPPKHILLFASSNESCHQHEYRHLHWFRTQPYVPYTYAIRGNRSVETPWDIKAEVMDAISKNWAGELSWRMKRVYELRLVAEKNGRGGGSQGYYIASMRALMPPESDAHRQAWSSIRKIGQVALTSILSSLQEGVTKYYRDEEDRTVMSHGLSKWIKEPRHAKLSFQHRMHPQISSIPREVFYEGEALLDVRFVSTGGRNWNYSRYEKRVVWLDVSGATVYRGENEKEAKKVIGEMKAFLRWAKQQNESYTIVILSFYEKQRKKIRDLLRAEYPMNVRRETRFDIDGISVRNYTVDKVQGREGDIVFLSMVQNRRVGFMDSPNRLNVAITRAKYQLVIIGDSDYFMKQKNSRALEEIARRTSQKTTQVV